MIRSIIHIDMDAFFASIEQLDNPQYRGKPVIVGADPKGGRGRGVVAACSYEARKFGIHSAMPISQAWRRCPKGVFVAPRGSRYVELSRKIIAIFRTYTDLVEPLSIDEAFLDVTGSRLLFGDAPKIGREIKERIRTELGLVASVGVAPNKFVAKIASDLGKPDGFVVVGEGEVREFLRELPIKRLWGVGEKTAETLTRRGMRTIGDIARLGERNMVSILGEHGLHLWRLSQGEDYREVVTESEAKSVGNETTFEEDTSDPDTVRNTLLYLCDKVAGRLRKYGFKAVGVTLKLRDEDFKTITRSLTREAPTSVTADLFSDALELLSRSGWKGTRRVRLLGVSAHRLVSGGGAPLQGNLFVDPAREGRKIDAEKAVDAVRAKFGRGALKRGALVKSDEE
ncbi:DNA polymerase IV [bacterium]|nr:MAG: DNA polymerase IV [bacterium]